MAQGGERKETGRGKKEKMSMDHAPDLDWFVRERETPEYGIIYVASPYWSPDENVKRARAQAAQTATAEMIREGLPAFSPIVYSATMQAETGTNPAQGWYSFDLNFLALARSMRVLEIPGWERSRGVLIELSFARARGMPVERQRWEDIRKMLDPRVIRTLEGR